MPEKRRSKRYLKRIKVAFGEKDYATSGFTLNLSKSGAFILSPKAFPLKTMLHVKLFGERDAWSAMEAEVRWRKEVPPMLRQVAQAGIGVRFIPPAEVVESMVAQLQSEKRFEVIYSTREELATAFARELKFGGVFIRTDESLPRDTEVMIELHLEFDKQTLEIAGRVMQVMPADPQAGRDGGLAVMFLNGSEAQQRIQSFLAG